MQTSIFDSYLSHQSLFKRNRDVLRPAYIPSSLPHRDEQIDQLASILATALKGERPSNILIFGKTGTGKTAVVKFLGKEVERLQKQVLEKKNAGQLDDNAVSLLNDDMEVGIPVGMLTDNEVHYVYINCEIVDTQYGVLQNIGNRFIDKWKEQIPFTGWPLERVHNALRDQIDSKKQVIVVILDEIDKLVYKSGDDVLYHLSTINDSLKQAKLSVIGISNDLKFTEFLDPRVKSRLGEEKMVFPPYIAEQLKDIMSQRADLAFEVGILEESVIPQCAALAAQEHGDARRALDLLRVAAELAERQKDKRVLPHHVDLAKNKLELDCVTEVIRTLPTQSKLLLFGIILNEEVGRTRLTTGDVYDSYKIVCQRSGISSLTQRRITDLVSEFDMLGLINARIISKGRYGRTREIILSVPKTETRNVLEEDEVFANMQSYRLKLQSTLM